ncbi:Zinc finger protein 91 [Blattella germanica]|nr:Zinc finger protein 91 [Blattella germanica]
MLLCGITGIKPYPCNLCGRRFTQLNALNQHKTSHQTNKDVSCSICRKMFKSHMVMRKHVRQLHRDKLAASGKDISTVRKDEHVFDNTENCRLENFNENLPDPLLLQYGMSVEKNKNSNSTAGKRNSNSTSPLYSLHIGSENSNGGEVLAEPSHDSDCDNVGEVANAVIPEPGPEANRDPLATSNTETTVPPSGKKQVRIYQCTECPKTFVKNSNFKQHLGIHFIEQQRYHCPNCGQTFAWKSTLNKHMMNHSTAPLPRYRCDLCSKEYSSATQVQEHIKRDHYKQRPYACVSCGKTFYKKYDLKIHIRTHTKERPYICGTCGKSFYHLSHIIRHERIHTGLRPYRCSDCGRQFNQSSSLKSHSLLSQGMELKSQVVFFNTAYSENILKQDKQQ